MADAASKLGLDSGNQGTNSFTETPVVLKLRGVGKNSERGLPVIGFVAKKA
jgi:hypothetical protein